MKCLPARLLAALAFLLAIAANHARADYLNWSYGTSTNPGVVQVDAQYPAGGWVGLQGISNGTGATSIPVLTRDIFLTRTGPFSSSYTLQLTITDNTTHDSGVLNFTGSINGDLIHSSPSMTTSFSTPQPLTLDGHVYTVTIPTAALAPGSNGMADIMAQVSVSGGVIASTAPEPASLTLAGLGALALTGYGWRRRKLSGA